MSNQGFTPEQRAEITRALEERGALLPCPRCGNRSFTLVNGFFNQPVQTEIAGLVLGGSSIPSVIVVCNKCAYMAQHAALVLGLSWLKEDNRSSQNAPQEAKAQ